MLSVFAERDAPPLPPTDDPVVDDDRSWFWYVLQRWPDPAVTNGPQISSPSSMGAYRALCASQGEKGELRRVVLSVWVRARSILGATIAATSGDATLDALAQRLYPPPLLDLSGAEAFRVTVYGRSLPAEETYEFELP